MDNQKSNACRKRRVQEGKPCSVAIPRLLQEAVIKRAVAEDRSFSAVVRRAVEAYVHKHAADS